MNPGRIQNRLEKNTASRVSKAINQGNVPRRNSHSREPIRHSNELPTIGNRNAEQVIIALKYRSSFRCTMKKNR